MKPRESQWKLYFILMALLVVAIVATEVLWTVIDLNKNSLLRTHLRDIRALCFGSLYLRPTDVKSVSSSSSSTITPSSISSHVESAH